MVKFTRTKQPGKSMKGTYKIIWTDEALDNLENIIAYLEKFWTEKEIRKFARLLDKQLILIKKILHCIHFQKNQMISGNLFSQNK